MGIFKSPSQKIPIFYKIFYVKPVEMRIVPKVFSTAVVIS